MDKNRYAVAIGVFDGVHRGHMAVIDSAAALESEGLVPAAFTFSMADSPKRGGMLISDELKREYLLKAGIKRIESPKFADFAEMDGESFVRETLIGRMMIGSQLKAGETLKVDVADGKLVCTPEE